MREDVLWRDLPAERDICVFVRVERRREVRVRWLYVICERWIRDGVESRWESGFGGLVRVEWVMVLRVMLSEGVRLVRELEVMVERVMVGEEEGGGRAVLVMVLLLGGAILGFV